MRKSALCCSLLPILASTSLAAPAPPKPPRVEWQARLGGLYFDNFFQAAEGLPEENVLAASLEGRLTARVHEDKPLEAYVEADLIVYEGFDPSAGITLGLRQEGKPGAFDVSAQYLGGRPSREIQDEFDRANVRALNGEYSHRIGDDFQVSALAEFRHETFDLSPDKANDVYSLGGALRYRGFGWRFSPEIGLRLGGRGARDDNEDLSQRELFVRLRFNPTEAVHVTLRYRRRGRDYSIENPGASNFGREDTRTQWTLTGDWRRSKSMTWNLYYALEDSDSTRSSGVFQTQLLALGVTLRF